MRTRVALKAGYALTAAERGELQHLLSRIPVGAEHHQECILDFVKAWRRLHLPSGVGRYYSIHNLRVTASAPPGLLEALGAALDAPDLRSTARPNCSCGLCRDLRAG